MSALLNEHADPALVPPPSRAAASFHRSLPGYEPTPVHALGDVARALGLGAVLVKDESNRFGLPAFKILGASWAVEQALRERPDVHTLVAASAGNHGRAVAYVARRRGFSCRVFLPERSVSARREAIASEGADIVVVDGSYEDAVELAAGAGAEPGVLAIADVGASAPAGAVIDGYATLFDEAAGQASFDLIVVPAGVGSLAAAAARHGAEIGVAVVAVEPVTAACLTASLAARRRVAVPTPGTTMAGLDCAEVSAAAWPSLSAGITGTITVSDAQAHDAMRELAGAGLRIGESGAAPVAALRTLVLEDSADALRR
ncbi:MAG TPA: pyridoxal-phosphate dependent enzyme, partial [Gaiellaceae bacterium]|nr:pyridoxal-phosphate dependent enzyme [Gaiellaceae bacterium]